MSYFSASYFSVNPRFVIVLPSLSVFVSARWMEEKLWTKVICVILQCVSYPSLNPPFLSIFFPVLISVPVSLHRHSPPYLLLYSSFSINEDRYEFWTANKRYHTTARCVICCGQILKKSTAGGWVRGVLAICSAVMWWTNSTRQTTYSLSHGHTRYACCAWNERFMGNNQGPTLSTFHVSRFTFHVKS